MRVKVLYFAAARDAADSRGETFVLPDRSSVGDLSAEICRAHPAMKAMSRSVRFSVNLELVETARALRESDVVGVLPPVAGG